MDVVMHAGVGTEVTRRIRPVTFHTSHGEVARFLKKPTLKRPTRDVDPLECVFVGRPAGDQETLGSGVSHFVALRALRIVAQMARNAPSSVQVFRITKRHKSGREHAMDVMVEVEPLSIAEREDIDRLASED